MLDDVIVTPVPLDNLPWQPNALIATLVPLTDPQQDVSPHLQQQTVSPDLLQQDVSPNLLHHHPLPYRVRDRIQGTLVLYLSVLLHVTLYL
ncbi:hypothetical protein V6N12_045024 [Hibiscus sabdariffa]|uniref:Uncharacterized protein n=1 Tax=Hibiscus sabdariffa TaxID=183260 RepID=A0ABR2G1M2_9ROSI